jgi:hypothetical protein
MKRTAASIVLFLFLISDLYSQKKIPDSEGATVKPGTDPGQPASILRDNTLEYYFFGSVPALVLAWGFTVWEWGTAPKWHVENDGWGIEQDSYAGGADKVAHTWGVYAVSRMATFVFERDGDSRGWSAFKGFLFGQFVGLGIEAGDGFGDTYGFSWGDMLWNVSGGAMALVFDLYPSVDDLVGFQFEYWPSKDHRARRDKWIEFTSDVSGQKFIFALKLGGIPYAGNTFLKYFQVDFGYYTRGYWYNPSHWDYESRHAYIGFSFNMSTLCESFLPDGKLRFSLSRFFKYYHAPIAYNPDACDYTLPGKVKTVQNR